MVQVEKSRAKENSGEVLNRLRAGRLANAERLMILDEIGKYARKMYNRYLVQNSQGYDLSLLHDALQYAPDVDSFENDYWVDTGDEKLNDLASYFEYGTGMYNTKYRKSNRTRITSKTAGKAMVFRKPWKGISGAMSVKGVRPVFMFRRTLKSIEFNRPYIQREIRFKLGI